MFYLNSYRDNNLLYLFHNPAPFLPSKVLNRCRLSSDLSVMTNYEHSSNRVIMQTSAYYRTPIFFLYWIYEWGNEDERNEEMKFVQFVEENPSPSRLASHSLLLQWLIWVSVVSVNLLFLTHSINNNLNGHNKIMERIPTWLALRNFVGPA